MTIQTISPCGIAILIDREDLQAVGAKAGDIDLDKARPIVSTALMEAGVSTHGIMEIEAFQNGSDVLIFARMLQTEPVFFVFDDLETLFSAVSAMDDVPGDTCLGYLGGEYYLTVGRDAPEAAAVLGEFALRRDLPPEFLLHIKEHGKLICPHDAVKRLKEYF